MMGFCYIFEAPTILDVCNTIVPLNLKKCCLL